MLVDEGLDAITDSLEGAQGAGIDSEERQADTFALAMLRKGGSAELGSDIFRMSSAELAVAAIRAGTERSIDPGHLLLSYASEHDDWLNANLALNYLPETRTALELVCHRFRANTDLERLTDENKEHLLSAQGFE